MSRFAPIALRLRVAVLVGPLAGSIASPAPAQDVLLDIQSPQKRAAAEYAVPIGDWNGDGVVDLAIGAPNDSSGASLGGAVRIHSGKDGSVLKKLVCKQRDARFGSLLARLPDIDGDGIDDLAVCAPYFDGGGTQLGSLFLFSGGTGGLLRRIDPVDGGAYPMGPIGDVDGDGICDLFVGHQVFSNVIHIHSGADGHEITSVSGNSGDQFGWTVSALDDLDGDGVQELVVGAPFFQNASKLEVGAAYVISTATGTVLQTQTGTFDGEDLGVDSAVLADLDGDGVREYAVMAGSGANGFGGTLSIFSGATGLRITNIPSPSVDAYLVSLSPSLHAVIDAGDVNGDGIHDLAIGGLWVDLAKATHGAEFLFSGRTFLELDRIEVGEPSISQGPALDLDGDGLSDIIVGTSKSNGDGEVRVYSGDDLWLNGNPPVAPSGATLDLTTAEGAPGALTIVALEAIDGVPTFLLVDGLGTLDSVGRRTVSKTVPVGLNGHDITFRSYAVDAHGRVIHSATQSIQF